MARLDQRQIEHREVWERKETIRLLYRDFHRRLLESCPEGPVLDIGGGTAHIKDSRPDILSIDILRFPGIDVVADAHRLPFPGGYFSGVVMLDVLHHLERPIEFLSEASRVLRPGGRLAMIEPAMTPIARRFYQNFHQEPVGQRRSIRAGCDRSGSRSVRRKPGHPVPVVHVSSGPQPAGGGGSIAARDARRMAEPLCISAQRRISRIGR